MANEPYDPYIPGSSKTGEPVQGTSNPKTAAIQQQIDDTVCALACGLAMAVLLTSRSGL